MSYLLIEAAENCLAIGSAAFFSEKILIMNEFRDIPLCDASFSIQRFISGGMRIFILSDGGSL